MLQADVGYNSTVAPPRSHSGKSAAMLFGMTLLVWKSLINVLLHTLTLINELSN